MPAPAPWAGARRMMIVLHVLFDLVVAGALFAECVWAARQSRALGAIVALGVGLRLASGLVLFAISYFDLGILRGLHTGGGFWVLAIDAQGYYAFATAASSHPWHVTWAVPSPSYVAALALWLRATGISVLAAILFNVVCYGVTVAALLAGLDPVDRREPFGWPAVVLSAFSFSPVLLLTSSQTLKDPFFAMLSAIACRAAFEIFQQIRRVPAARALTLATTTGVAILAVGLIAALRAYYAAFLWLGFASGFAALVAAPGGPIPSRAKATLVGATALALMWVVITIGGGRSYQAFEREVARLGFAGTVQFNRAGFEGKGGGTSLSAPVVGPIEPLTVGGAPPPAAAPAVSPPPLSSNPTDSPSTRPLSPPFDDVITMGGFRHLAIGLLAMFVPMSVLKALSIVAFSGGKGLLLIADLDTVFLDLTLLTIAAILSRERPRATVRAPSVLFTVVVVGISTILLAYVVTNFGTLFRLRLLAAVPAWMAPFAFRSRSDG